jgi:molybdopterin-guanine dinucleotide biosynthesis protein A/MOSC domain-containing protein YiiM
MTSPKTMRVVALNISETKGVPKNPIPSATFVRNHGILKDAHAGETVRQVSLLSLESIRTMEKRLNTTLSFGRFAENVVVDGSLHGIRPKDIIAIGNDVVLEVTVIGKECHKACPIRLQTGDCIMPREGIFARVVASGTVRLGDEVRIFRSSDLAVVLLAGGKSTRFGSDKRFAMLPDGRTWLDSAIYKALELSEDVLVSVGAHEIEKTEGKVRFIPDKVASRGPLGGLVTCLERSSANFVIVFPVDQTQITSDLLRILATKLRGAGVCFEQNGVIEPFPCVLNRKAVLSGLQHALDEGILSMKDAMKSVGVALCSTERLRELGDPSRLLSNWNTQEDVALGLHHGGTL